MARTELLYLKPDPASMVRTFMETFECAMPETLQRIESISDEPFDLDLVMQTFRNARKTINDVFGAAGKERQLCIDLIFEELGELIEAEMNGDVIEIADALGDLEYVIHYSALKRGIPLREVFAEIHRSNMTKLDADGRPIHHPKTGKIVKGPNYEPPNIAAILQEATCTR